MSFAFFLAILTHTLSALLGFALGVLVMRDSAKALKRAVELRFFIDFDGRPPDAT